MPESIIPAPGEVSGIYSIIHNPSGQCYVGSAKNVLRRLRQHQEILRRGGHSPPFQAAWDKDGEKAFRAVLLESCHMDQLVERERAWHSTLVAEFTRGRGGRWHSHSIATRNLFSAQRLGRPCPSVSRANRARAGFVWAAKDPDLWRARLSASRTGYKAGPRTIETRKKIGAASRRTWEQLTPEARAQRGRHISIAKRAARRGFNAS